MPKRSAAVLPAPSIVENPPSAGPTDPKIAWPYPEVTAMTADRARNQWVKKIRGRLWSFGVIFNSRAGRPDPDSFDANARAALRQYQADGPALHAGLPRDRVTLDGVTVGEIVAAYLKSRLASLRQGELDYRTYRDYESVGRTILRSLGPKRPAATLRPVDFERLLRSLKVGPTRRGNFVVWCRSIFRWAYDQAEMLEAPPRFGKAFRGATGKQKREMRQRQGVLMFERDPIRRLLTQPDADVHLHAMILLGINGAFGNTDVATLHRQALDLSAGLITFPRHKTAIPRIIPLWPETIAALKASLAARPPANPRRLEHDRLVFLTPDGLPWVHRGADRVGRLFRDLMTAAGMDTTVATGLLDDDGRPVVKHLGYYCLRRTWRTIADEFGDQHAAHVVMGHAIPGMSGIYVQRINHDRLRAVVDHVRHWLLDGWSMPWPR